MDSDDDVRRRAAEWLKDIWVGVFIDRPKRRIYIFPVPCFGVVIQLEGKP